MSDFSEDPFSFQSIKLKTHNLIANGTGRGLKNLGWASGCTRSVALCDRILLSSGLNRASCLSKRDSSLFAERTEAIRFQFGRMYRRHFLPNSPGPFPAPIVTVPKPDGRIRICGDFKVTINQALSVDQYPLPKPEDLFTTLTGGQKFTKLDLSQAYLQLEISEESKKYCTVKYQACTATIAYRLESRQRQRCFRNSWTPSPPGNSPRNLLH